MQLMNASPYSGFTDDRERRIALRNRDIRLTIISIVSSVASITSALIYFWPTISKFVH